EITYTGESILERAKNISISKEDIKENLEKLNDEVFTAESIKVSMDPDVFIRKKDINKARREGIKLLERKISSAFHRDPIKIEKKVLSEKKTHKKEHNIELLDNRVDPDRLKKYDNIYIR